MIYVKRDTNMNVHPYLLASLAYLGYKSKYDWKVTSGRRDNQASLYAKGRTEIGSVVTDAKEGQSPHEYGLAYDAYPTVDGGATVILDVDHPAFAERDALFAANPLLARCIKSNVVISSGADKPHVEVSNWVDHKAWQQTAIAVGVVSAIVSIFLISSRL